MFFRSLAFLSWGRRCNSNRAAGNRQGANDGATRTAANRHARHVRRFLGRERGNYHEQERQGGIRRPRAQVQQSNREPTTAVSRVPPPPHVRILANFIRLLPLASYCADETERRASAAPKATEIHKTRNPRPFTGPFFGPYMHPNRPLDLKIVFNQHPKKRRILQINCRKKCDRNIKCICGELAFQILKIAWFVAAFPWQLKLHLYGAHIENFGFSLFLR